MNEIVDIDITDSYVCDETLSKLEEGDMCPLYCQGHMILVAPQGCCCHINPPCSRCVDECNLECNVCGYPIAVHEWRDS